jgi:hypothetical protein
MRALRAVPAPPPDGAMMLTFDQCAGLAGVRRRAIEELKRTDPAFPKAVLVSPQQPRIVRSEFEAYLLSRPRGWANRGRRVKAIAEAARG